MLNCVWYKSTLIKFHISILIYSVSPVKRLFGALGRGRSLFLGVIDWGKANSVLLDGIFQNHIRIANWNSLGYVSNFVVDFFYFYGCFYHYIVVILWWRTFLVLLVGNFSFTAGWCYLYPMKSQGYLKDVNVWRMINIRQRSWVLRNCLTYLSLNLPFWFLFIPATISYLPQ